MHIEHHRFSSTIVIFDSIPFSFAYLVQHIFDFFGAFLFKLQKESIPNTFRVYNSLYVRIYEWEHIKRDYRQIFWCLFEFSANVIEIQVNKNHFEKFVSWKKTRIYASKHITYRRNNTKKMLNNKTEFFRLNPVWIECSQIVNSLSLSLLFLFTLFRWLSHTHKSVRTFDST